MASVGHVVVGALAGRVYAGSTFTRRQTVAAVACFAALAFVPDIDVLWVGLGSPDHGALGHRGFTHTFAFALLLGVCSYWVASRAKLMPLRTLWFVMAAVASHGVLDALTFDSRGVMLFWPLSDVAIAFGWRPIPSAPTGLAFVGMRGLEVVAVELIFFAPVLVAVLRPPRSFASARSSLIAVGGVAALVVCSLFFAELVWRNISVVSRLEVSSAREFAVREQHRLRVR